jgi:hypothetical protein
MLLRPYQLTVLTTSECNAVCDHCSQSSHPSRQERATVEQMRRAIQELHEASPLATVIFSGGEPTLLGQDLITGIQYANSLGISTRLVTNAHWASTPAAARASLVGLREAGLQQLVMSADDYHLPFVPFENVENGWHASKGLGFQSVCIANCSGPSSKITPAFIRERLGEQIPAHVDDDGDAPTTGAVAADGTRYTLFHSPIQRLGRGRARIRADDLGEAPAPAALEGGCPWAVRSAALSVSNHLVACCAIETDGNPILDFGDLTTTTAPALLQRANDDVVVNAIALLGPMFLRRFLNRQAPDLPFRQDYSSICELCEHIVRRPGAVEALRQHEGELAGYVRAARALTSQALDAT